MLSNMFSLPSSLSTPNFSRVASTSGRTPESITRRPLLLAMSQRFLRFFTPVESMNGTFLILMMRQQVFLDPLWKSSSLAARPKK